MLRISVQNGALTTRFKLEGKLSHEWVCEAAEAWADLRALHGKKKVIIDLFDVEFVDELGRQLLTEMQSAGAQLIGSGPMISALIEEINAANRELQPIHNEKADNEYEN